MNRFMTSDSFSYRSPIGNVHYNCITKVALVDPRGRYRVTLDEAPANIVNALCENSFGVSTLIEDGNASMGTRFAAEAVLSGIMDLCEKIINASIMELV